jgi:hypothetical protein
MRLTMQKFMIAIIALSALTVSSLAATAQKGRSFEDCKTLGISRGLSPHTNGPKNPWLGFMIKCEAGEEK